MAEHLRFIRDTMERSAAFTAVSGWGHVGIGASAIGAALLASWQASGLSWLRVWLAEGILAIVIGLLPATWKANRRGCRCFLALPEKWCSDWLLHWSAGAFLTL